MAIKEKFKGLANQLEGELFWDETLRRLYATDASAYREMPLAIAYPKNAEDIRKLVLFARENQTSIIPRTAGTSLAGQVVGAGMVVDVSKYLTRILEVNPQEKWVRVQPGVIRDELNLHLKEYGLYFGPETSTANRAMMGGMVGNNSSGANSIVYGSTRDHLIEVKSILSDGSEATFGAISKREFQQKCEASQGNLENDLYRTVNEMLSDTSNQTEITAQFPKKQIHRRNTGYALDLLMDSAPFTDSEEPFNFCRLMAGSEGTLAFLTEIKLNLEPLPPANKGLLCAHFESIHDSLKATLVALKYEPLACELMDHYILECTKQNIKQKQNRSFVKGDPAAILMIELAAENMEEVKRKANQLSSELEGEGLGYHFPFISGDDQNKAWELRKAGLGLLANIPGDAKPVPVIEDTAVVVTELPDFIQEFNQILKTHDLYCVHYAHAGAGEIHLRPIINLKEESGNKLFRIIAEEIASLVKKYQGSLSGEHGDGRLRGEFIPFMVGPQNYDLMKRLKQAWDPQNVFNPGKIVDTPSMNTFLRYTPGQETPQFETIFNFKETEGILRAAELCNGSGDCRKTHLSGGTMCPSYMATKNEKDTTRARANILREMLTFSTKPNRFDHEEIKEVMDLCLSCKGCKSECPSNIDLAKLKSEFLHQYYSSNGVPFRTRLIANFTRTAQMGSQAPGFFNFLVSNPLTGYLFKIMAGISTKRPMPRLGNTTLRKWYQKNWESIKPENQSVCGRVFLFCDEFTNYYDPDVGVKAIKLLTRLGYEVILPEHLESGRTLLSKGLLKKAREIAITNVKMLRDQIGEKDFLVGIEPSAILSFRDEYLALVPPDLAGDAQFLAARSLMLDEFISHEADSGNIKPESFSDQARLIKLHGHCHQKALASVVPTKKMLSLPANYRVELIPSGCCGMAGSFGYEKEHYDLSLKVGELVLFPSIRDLKEDVIVSAPGTSCRHQIQDGTGKTAHHPAEILFDALA